MPSVPQAVACAAILTAAALLSHAIPGDAGPVVAAAGWLSRMLCLVAWMFAISVWHIRARQTVSREQHKQVARKLRALCRRIGAVETRVNELSADRTQAAAAVTSLFRDRAPRN